MQGTVFCRSFLVLSETGRGGTNLALPGMVALLAAWWIYIAATARVHGMTLVTRNINDMVEMDVPLLNPFAQ